MAAASIESKMGTQTFSLFPRFPIEIRLKIWEVYTNLQPRIVEVCLIKDDFPPGARYSHDHRNTQNPFYSPTPLPRSLFNINRESRGVALSKYTLGFPNGPRPAQIRWNPAIDTIFLPAWCFQYEVCDFVAATSVEEKGLIQRLAFETLVRMSSDNERMINCYIEVEGFRSLREVVLVHRLPDYTGCGCCHEFDGPEEGVVGFREIEEGVKEEDGEASEDGVNEDEELMEWPKRTTMSEEAMEVFLSIRENDPGYGIPSVKEMHLTRDGVRI